MKRRGVLVPVFLAVVVLFFGFLTDVPAAPPTVKIGKVDVDPAARGLGTPKGNFLKSCGNCRVDSKGELTCECRCGSQLCVKQVKSLEITKDVASSEVARTYRTTKLTDWLKCKDGVMNVDGHLMCQGSFDRSCGSCAMYKERGDDRLCCNNCGKIKKDSNVILLPGDRKDTAATACYVGSPHWKNCSEGLSNCDGSLVCGPCPAPKTIPKKDVKVGKVDINPAARNLGTPKGGFLKSCGNCVVDAKGLLTCECRCGSPLCVKQVSDFPISQEVSQSDISRAYRTTDLPNWSTCKNGIMNVDGHLMCQGSFDRSCGSCAMYKERGDDRLCCNNCGKIKKDSNVILLPGDRKDTAATACYVGSPHWKNCSEGLSNCDGSLVCGPCPAPKTIPKKDVKVGKLDVNPAAQSLGTPKGGFLKSCGNCVVDEKGVLKCECRCGSPLCVKQVADFPISTEVKQSDISRAFRSTELADWSKCKDGLMNVDGHLMCQGSFERSCGSCVMYQDSAGRLCCGDCKDKKGKKKPTSCYMGSTHWKYCYDGLSNCDGDLACGPCSETKSDTKKDVKVGKLEINPAAQGLGTPKGSFLKSCGNCVVDEKGVLRCECGCGSPLCERLSGGKYRTTDLADWNKCKNGIMNIDGNLMCDGSFTRSCGSCVMYQDNAGRLCCGDCKDKKGKKKPTSCYMGSTHWKYCYDGLNNCNGDLTCGPCR